MTAQEYNATVRQLADPLFRFARKCTGRDEDAQDAVQSAFAALWEKRSDVPVEKAKAYLFQVAYRQSVDGFRHGSRTVHPEEIFPDAAGGSLPSADLRRHLERALDRLDEQARALVLLKDYEGYSYQEIGNITGLSDAQVRVYLHRARKTLKNYLVSVEHIL
jgi:RNA polymerase sigma factor (sigma-70 family)